MSDLIPDPNATALLIMDVQQGIIARAPDEDAYLALLRRAQSAARERGVRVGYVRVAMTDEEAAAVPSTNSRFHASAVSGRLNAGAPSTQLDPRLEPADEEFVVRKKRVGALSTTDLDARLRQAGVDTLVLCGIATSGVVLSTVRDAADRDYRLVVLEDGCIDGDDEVHRVLTQKVFPRQASVVTVDEFVAALAD